MMNQLPIIALDFESEKVSKSVLDQFDEPLL